MSSSRLSRLTASSLRAKMGLTKQRGGTTMDAVTALVPLLQPVEAG